MHLHGHGVADELKALVIARLCVSFRCLRTCRRVRSTHRSRPGGKKTSTRLLSSTPAMSPPWPYGCRPTDARTPNTLAGPALVLSRVCGHLLSMLLEAGTSDWVAGFCVALGEALQALRVADAQHAILAAAQQQAHAVVVGGEGGHDVDACGRPASAIMSRQGGMGELGSQCVGEHGEAIAGEDWKTLMARRRLAGWPAVVVLSWKPAASSSASLQLHALHAGFEPQASIHPTTARLGGATAVTHCALPNTRQKLVRSSASSPSPTRSSGL